MNVQVMQLGSESDGVKYLMRKVIIPNKSAGQIMEMAQELRDSGLVQGTDFDFAYYQGRWDEMIGEIPRETVFTFYTEKYATFYQLKWSE